MSQTRAFSDFTSSAATVSHETRFECQKLTAFWDFTSSVAALLHEMRFECQKLKVFCDLTSSAATLSYETRFERQKTDAFFAILHPRRQPVRTKRDSSSVKNWSFLRV